MPDWSRHLQERLASLRLSPERLAEVIEELAQHLDERYDELRREGTSDGDARRLVIDELRGPDALAAYMRPLRLAHAPLPIVPGLPRRVFLADLWQDLRYAARMLRKQPGFTVAAVLTLALGIGANTAIFSLADAVLFRPLPVERPHDLVLLRQTREGSNIFPFTSAAATELSAPNTALAGLAVFRPLPNTQVGIDGVVHLALRQTVSGNYHSVLGVRAALGRTLTEQDRDAVVVISHRYWHERFAGDRTVLGRALVMDGRPFTIVGVTPKGFFGTQPGRNVDVTTPLAAQSTTMGPNARWLYLIGRLAPGVSREQARGSLQVPWSRLSTSASVPARFPITLEVDSGAQGMNELRRQFSMPLQILIAIVGVVLLVACANLAGLLLVRSSPRRQEIAIRLSLGAVRGRIVRQFFTESVLLAVIGSVAGVITARWATEVLVAMMSRGRAPILLDVAFDSRQLVFAASITLVSVILFGLIPALTASRTGVQSSLKRRASDAEPGRPAWARGVVIVQIALLALLLTSAGLFARSLRNLRHVDAGFRSEQVLVVNLATGPAYRARLPALYADLSARFAALPAVTSVSIAMDTPPLGEQSMSYGISIPGRAPDGDDGPSIYHNFVGPRFFETMGIPVLAGRGFDARDTLSAPTCVAISESVARRYFGGENALGRQILVGRELASIVGVVKDVRYTSLRSDAPLTIYHPASQRPGNSANTFLIRTAGASVEALTPSIQREVRAAARDLPPPAIVALEDQVAAVLVEERMLAVLSTVIAAMAALLAAIGIYGTLAATVVRRQREIGIRMALGARPGNVVRMIIAEVLLIAGVGLAIGIPLAIAGGRTASRLLDRVLFELSPTDPLVLATASACILGIALVAAYLPARRAARIDPAAAIKYD